MDRWQIDINVSKKEGSESYHVKITSPAAAGFEDQGRDLRAKESGKEMDCPSFQKECTPADNLILTLLDLWDFSLRKL